MTLQLDLHFPPNLKDDNGADTFLLWPRNSLTAWVMVMLMLITLQGSGTALDVMTTREGLNDCREINKGIK